MMNEPSNYNPTNIDNNEVVRRIYSHANELKKNVDAQKRIEDNPFPFDVFPSTIQEIIRDANDCLNYPIDFIGIAMLYAISVSIGNTKKVELKKGFQESAVLYLAIVGLPGTAKSHALNFALKPIWERDEFFFKKYEKERREYQKFSRLSKEEKLMQNNGEPALPILQQHLMSDATIESVASALNSNIRGIGLYFDELLAWTKNFNRYTKGSEEQFFLSVWSGAPVRINRKTSEPIFISMPFISIAGTIQPGKITELAKSMVENGGVDRLLWAIPKDIKRTAWSEEELGESTTKKWAQIISNLLDIELNLNESFMPQPEILYFTEEAKELLFEWQRQSVELGNKSDNLENNTFIVKLELYVIRLALILHMAKIACDESVGKNIGIESVQGAIKLAGYFNQTALQVRSILADDSPLSKLREDKKKLYNNLPDEFTTKQGVEIALNNHIRERTFKRFLSDKRLFSQNTWGNYEKLY
jgi:hypothetical protein